jgi:hypothetical protein
MFDGKVTEDCCGLKGLIEFDIHWKTVETP